MDLFSSPIGRLAFLGRYILGFVLLVIGNMSLDIAAKNQNLIFICLSVVVMAAGTVYVAVFGILPRLVSVGLSRWFMLVFLVPVANILFLVFLFVCPAGWLVKRDEVV
jgi:hypothetical protein